MILRELNLGRRDTMSYVSLNQTGRWLNSLSNHTSEKGGLNPMGSETKEKPKLKMSATS